jgi:hypothetical protein
MGLQGWPIRTLECGCTTRQMYSGCPIAVKLILGRYWLLDMHWKWSIPAVVKWPCILPLQDKKICRWIVIQPFDSIVVHLAYAFTMKKCALASQAKAHKRRAQHRNSHIEKCSMQKTWTIPFRSLMGITEEANLPSKAQVPRQWKLPKLG